MKKIIIIALSVVIIGLLVACTPKDEGHRHDYDIKWTRTQTHHWRVCEFEGCTSISEKAEHTWDETGVCRVCLKKSGEAGVIQEVWERISVADNFKNVTIRMYGEFSDGDSFNKTVKFDGKIVWADGGKVTDAGIVTSTKNEYVNTILGILGDSESFTYDRENSVYGGIENIEFEMTVDGIFAEITVWNIEVTVGADQKLEKISCNMKQEFDGDELNLTVTFELSDYGTTVIE